MKKPSMISILLFLTGLLCIIALIFFFSGEDLVQCGPVKEDQGPDLL